MHSKRLLLTVVVAALMTTACASSAPPVSGLQRPLPAALLQLCPDPGPAPGNDVDDVAGALMELYGLYGQCAGAHAQLVQRLESKGP